MNLSGGSSNMKFLIFPSMKFALYSHTIESFGSNVGMTSEAKVAEACF